MMNRIAVCVMVLGALCAPAPGQTESQCNGGANCPDALLTPISATGSFNDLSDPDNLKITIGNSFLVELNVDGTSFPIVDVVTVDFQIDILGGNGLNCVDFTVDTSRSDLVLGFCSQCFAGCVPVPSVGLIDFSGAPYLTVDFLAYAGEMTLTCKDTGSFTLEYGGLRHSGNVSTAGAIRYAINIVDDPTHFESISVECISSPCGNGILESGFGEECDDGNGVENDACGSDCLINACGDGVLNQASEVCDDGNFNNNDDCTNNCTIAFCGDAILHEDQSGAEQCDDGNGIDDDECSNDCRLTSEPFIPAVSEWGMVALVTLLLIGLTIRFRRYSITNT